MKLLLLFLVKIYNLKLPFSRINKYDRTNVQLVTIVEMKERWVVSARLNFCDWRNWDHDGSARRKVRSIKVYLGIKLNYNIGLEHRVSKFSHPLPQCIRYSAFQIGIKCRFFVFFLFDLNFCAIFFCWSVSKTDFLEA